MCFTTLKQLLERLVSKCRENMKHKRKAKNCGLLEPVISIRNEKEEENSLPYLPEPIWHDILARIPAEILHEKFRHICKAWHNLISSKEFIALQNSTQSKHELLVQVLKRNLCSKTTSLDLDDKEIVFKSKNFQMRRMGKISSSCKGLILVHDPKNEKQLHVLNIVANCRVTLPPCVSNCSHTTCGLAFTFNPSTKECKVVHIYADSYGFEMYTLGCLDGNWKRLPGPFEGKVYERPSNVEDFRWSDHVTINGHILQWYVESNEYVISMDASYEKCSKTYLPDCDQKIDKDNYKLLQLGGDLSFVHQVSSIQTDVWILENG